MRITCRFASLLLASLVATTTYGALGKSSVRDVTPQLQQVKLKLQDQTIAELTSGTATLSTLAGLVSAANLTDVLDALEVTVFAPANDAFAGLGQDVLALYVTPDFSRHLTDLVLYHVTEGTILSTELTDGLPITMLTGEIITVGVNESAISLSNSQGEAGIVTAVDILATNGVVHLIDSVLLPSFVFMSTIDLPDVYSTLVSLVVMVGIAPDLENGVLTLLAPNNDAFAALPDDTLAFFISPDGEETIIDILLYHILPSVVTSDKLLEGMEVTSLQGSPISISFAGGTIMMNDATVVEPDILAVVSVIHGIDTVLIPPAPPPTIADIAADTQVLSTFVSALVKLGLMDALSDPETNLFAPTNDAFTELDQTFLEKLLTPEWSQHYTDILLYHVNSAGVAFSSDSFDSFEITMLNGETIALSTADTTVFLSNSQGVNAAVIAPDILATNGVVHLINDVMLPSFVFRTVIDPGDTYSILLSLIVFANLDTDLMGGSWTLFAPSNDAFAAVPRGTVSFLASVGGSQQLREVLLYHLLSGVVTSDKLVDGAAVTTLEGNPFSISVTEVGAVMINDATVVEADILASNGVTHGIDTVLFPSSALPPTIADLAPS
jgi:transforming growth factor-beta-induced protein